MRKEKQKDPHKTKRYQEGRHTFINCAHGHLRNVFYHEYADGHGRDDDADHQNNAKENSEPDGIKAELQDCRIEDRSGKDHERKVIDERPPDFVDQADEDQNQIAIQW